MIAMSMLGIVVSLALRGGWAPPADDADVDETVEEAAVPEPDIAEPEPETATTPTSTSTSTPTPTPTPTPTTTSTSTSTSTGAAAAVVDGLRPGGFDRAHYWVPNSWPVAQPCDFVLTRRDACLTLRGEVFAGYRHTTVGGDPFSEFSLDRAELGSGFVWRVNRRFEAGLGLGLEAIRSAGPESLAGIDGDSFVARLLETYAQAVVHVGPIDLGARVGLVPERWIEQVQKGHDIRGIFPLASERGLFFDRSDLGATVTASGWKGRVEVDLQVVNGEGRAQRELNAGKNTAVMITARPILRRHAKGPITLAVHGGYRDGSLGPASLRNHRGAAAVTFRSPWVYAGAEYAHALGYRERTDVVANALGVWASGHVWAPWIGLFAQYDRYGQEVAVADAVVHRLGVGAFGDAFPYIDRNRRRIRLYVGYEHEAYGDEAAPLPGVPEALTAHRVLVQVQAFGLLRAY